MSGDRRRRWLRSVRQETRRGGRLASSGTRSSQSKFLLNLAAASVNNRGGTTAPLSGAEAFVCRAEQRRDVRISGDLCHWLSRTLVHPRNSIRVVAAAAAGRLGTTCTDCPDVGSGSYRPGRSLATQRHRAVVRDGGEFSRRQFIGQPRCLLRALRQITQLVDSHRRSLG